MSRSESALDPHGGSMFADALGQEILAKLIANEGLKSIAIVGSREAGPLGMEWAHRVATSAAERGVVVISGGARGIDYQAHVSARERGGETLAILGSGLASLNHRHRALSHRGVGLASPFPPHQSPRRWTFPKRNLKIAALSSSTVVIQASENSGALITARESLRLKREVWVLCHLPTEPLHRGCLKLLNEGAKPLLSETSWMNSLSPKLKASAAVNWTTDDQNATAQIKSECEVLSQKRAHPSALLRAASDTPRSLEWLAARSSMSYELALLEATNLELEGWLTPVIGVGYLRAYPR